MLTQKCRGFYERRLAICICLPMVYLLLCIVLQPDRTPTALAATTVPASTLTPALTFPPSTPLPQVSYEQMVALYQEQLDSLKSVMFTLLVILAGLGFGTLYLSRQGLKRIGALTDSNNGLTRELEALRIQNAELEKSNQELNVTVLRQLLVNRFDLEELRALCVDLGMNFDNLRGEGQEAKAREFVAYLRRRDQLNLLVGYVRQHRPDIEL